MLSRVASSIYWMARYVERAESLARFVDVALTVSLDHMSSQQWEPLIRATGDEEIFEKKYSEYTSENVRQFLTFDVNYQSSMISCLSAARENARTVREAISSESWECLNDYYLFLSQASKRDISYANSDLFTEIKKQSHLFSGIFDSTMSRDKGWYFANIGRFLERADKTSRILDVKYFTLLPQVTDVGTTVDDLLWSAVLRSVSGFEMFRKRFHTLTIERIIDFLMLDDRFPRAINYCIRTAAGSLARVGGPIEASENEPLKLAEALQQKLANATNRTIIGGGVHEFIDSIQTDLNELGTAIRNTYFAKRTQHMPQSHVHSQKQTQIQSQALS
ncbi:MAG: alpha-E domain-containing protein [Planctomycetales bacterium]|nr:alpha-E domain-containing protein [Planctomycetales bacterium]